MHEKIRTKHITRAKHRKRKQISSCGWTSRIKLAPPATSAHVHETNGQRFEYRTTSNEKNLARRGGAGRSCPAMLALAHHNHLYWKNVMRRKTKTRKPQQANGLPQLQGHCGDHMFPLSACLIGLMSGKNHPKNQQKTALAQAPGTTEANTLP